MAQIQPTVTLLTGPNRGLGRGLLEALLQRPHNVVIAGVRDPAAQVSRDLEKLPRAEGARLIVLEYDAANEAAATNMVDALGERDITYIDRVIANAGFSDTATSVLAAKKQDINRHLDVHLFGTLALFQATESLLKKSNDPKFIAMSSGLASMGVMEYMPGPWYCYGVTKVALNYTIRKMHFEHEWLTAVVLNPGWMKTDMGAFAAKAVGMDASAAPVDLADAVQGSLDVLDSASREKYAGQFISHELQSVPW